MDLKIFTIQLDPETGVFDDEPIRSFLAKRDLHAVHEHFFIHEGVPTWALLITYRERDGRRGHGRDQTDWRATLPDEERTLYDGLRAWRNQRAEQVGKPPYIILTNRQLATVAQRRPVTLGDLEGIPGFGAGRLRDYGADILAVVLRLTSPDTSAQGKPDDPPSTT